MLNETYYWSIPFGKWNGIPIRLHMLLFIAAAVIFGIEFHFIDERPMLLGTALITVLLGAIAIGLHISAQLLVLRRYHNTIKAICVVPWGAIYHLGREVPSPARCRSLLFGIFTNIIAVGFCVLVLTPGTSESLYDILNPFRPRYVDWNNVDRSVVEIFAWLNFAITLAALIPIAPFDLGYFLENWGDDRLRDVDPIQRYTMLFAIGQLFALGMFFVAYFVRDWNDGPLRPAWLWPVMLGVVLFFSARQHYLRRLQETLPRREYQWQLQASKLHSFSSAEQFQPQQVSLDDAWNDRENDDQWDRWMEENQASRSEAVQAREKTEDDLLDQILHKVGESGIASLTKDEQELLNRVSQRYRSRRPTEQSS